MTTLADIERRAIEAALHRHGGHVARAAAELGVGRMTVYRRIKQFPLSVKTRTFKIQRRCECRLFYRGRNRRTRYLRPDLVEA